MELSFGDDGDAVAQQISFVHVVSRQDHRAACASGHTSGEALFTGMSFEFKVAHFYGGQIRSFPSCVYDFTFYLTVLASLTRQRENGLDQTKKTHHKNKKFSLDSFL